MSALPRITPSRTCTSLSASVPAMYDVYPPRLPTAPDIPSRVNPLRPPPPQRRTVSMETWGSHWHNDQRTTRMKQREHYRYHNQWSKYYYGSPAEVESQRSYVRAVLKQQMTDKDLSRRQTFFGRVKESEQAVAKDQQTRLDDLRDLQRKHTHLCTFRDENKKLMERQWDEEKKRKYHDDKYDREQLRYNPINWSMTLT